MLRIVVRRPDATRALVQALDKLAPLDTAHLEAAGIAQNGELALHLAGLEAPDANRLIAPIYCSGAVSMSWSDASALTVATAHERLPAGPDTEGKLNVGVRPRVGGEPGLEESLEAARGAGPIAVEYFDLAAWSDECPRAVEHGRDAREASDRHAAIFCCRGEEGI